jgi:hypothetical protein
MSNTIIPCSLSEVISVLDTSTTEAYCEFMRMMFSSQFIAGKVVRAVSTPHNKTYRASYQLSADLLVKTVALEKSGLLFSREEEWCYLDFLQHVRSDPALGKTKSSFRKVTLSLHPDDYAIETERKPSARNYYNVLTGFLFEEEKANAASPGCKKQCTRISYFGEHFFGTGSDQKNPVQKKWNQFGSANRSVKSRLLFTADTLDRMHLLVRRRRLGMQELIDEINVKPTNTSCARCSVSFVVARKRLCHLCGFNVCDHCSSIEAREPPRSPQRHDQQRVVAHVRICTMCVARVDQCRLKSCGDPFVLENEPVTSVTELQERDDPSVRTESLGSALTDLLHETLLVSKSESQKASVISVIKEIVSANNSSSGSDSSSRHHSDVPVVLTDASVEAELISALQSPSLRSKSSLIPLDECVVSSESVGQRSYQVELPEDPAAPIPYPIPANEAARLEIIRSQKLGTLTDVPELDMICSMASKELQCVGAMVTVVEQDTFHVVATDIEALPTRNFPRAEGFCSRTILDSKPLIVPHPESDIRFGYMKSVNELNLGFYCGFPLFSEDYTVIGSLCCMGPESRKLSQEEFTVMQKLADVTSRILRTQGNRAKDDK